MKKSGRLYLVFPSLAVLAFLAPCTTATQKIQLDSEEILAIQLPDVRIASATRVEGSSGENTATHYEVEGTIGGTIRFEVLLPAEWNGRYVMGGGGGYVGSVVNVMRSQVHKGYATIGTDTGHQWPSGIEAGWALDDVLAQVNFGHVAVHRTAEVGKAIVRACYGREPVYSYFVGCSRGGGQAMMESQRYPEDFDGIVAGAPAFDWTGFMAAMVNVQPLIYPDPASLQEAVITKDNLKLLAKKVLEQCDKLDGVEDGMLDNPCDCEFDWSAIPECEEGVSGPDCLTGAQREALQAIYEGPANDAGPIHPGMPFGSEGEEGFFTWIIGPVPDLLEKSGFPNLWFGFGTEFYKYLIFNDPEWDYSTYDLADWERDTHLAGTFLNATDPDLSGLKDSGGKLLIWHGWSDAALSALATIKYYDEAEQIDPGLRDYCRLFLLPAVCHCGGGTGPDKVDWFEAMIDWVENGKAPERLVARKTDESGEVVRSRPVYPYPLRASYKGTGSTDDAESFILEKP